MWKCEKHRTNEGFYDENGNWHCWKCYEENPYYNPDGKVIDEYIDEPFEVRLLDCRNCVRVELWKVKRKPRLINSETYRDLSRGMREFRNTIKRIQEKKQNEKQRETGIVREIPHWNLDCIRELIREDCYGGESQEDN